MRVGTGRADLSFPDGLGLFGYGPLGGRGLNVPPGSEDSDTLQARALYMDSENEKLLVVGFDVASGSRVVHRALLAALAERGHRLRPSHLCLIGTHTHSGPGHSFGNLYDVFGQRPFLHRRDVVDELVVKGLAAAEAAITSVAPCRVGVAQHVLWGAARNRSLLPFLANFDGDLTRWSAELDLVPPAWTTPEEQAIDPRLTVVAFVGNGGEPLATWATWSCHPASIPRSPLRAYHRDWPGVAVDLMEKSVPFAMVHQGANGDASALPSGEVRIKRPFERVRALGEAVGRAWQRAFEDAASRADEAALEVAFHDLVPGEEGLPPFEIGSPVVVGSEEFDPGFFVKAFGEDRSLPFRRGPHGPKRPVVGPLQWPLRLVPALRPSLTHPVWLVRIGTHLFFASPFEQTTYAARTAEKSLREAWRAARGEALTASPIGLAGDYAGYVTTPAEYALQHYEGGHTIYGRDQLAALGRVWSRLIPPS